jgi:hypothetical protein
MTLNHFFKPKKQVSLKAALRRMRSMWLKGPVDRFDEKLSRILECSLEHAATVRESWLEMGFLCYDRRGLLT